jgi:predicted O-methyltransferase YrrM
MGEEKKDPVKAILEGIKERSYENDKLSMHFLQIPGWLTPEEGKFLYEMARQAPGKGWAVELGSYCGRSANVIAQLRPLVCVDDWETGVEEDKKNHPDLMKEFITNTHGLPVSALRAKTTVAANGWGPGVISFLYVDAGHGYQEVIEDLAAWCPKLAPNAILVMHDVAPGWPGVMKAAREMPPCFRPIGQQGSCVSWRYVPQPVDFKSEKKLAIMFPLSAAYAYSVLTPFALSMFDLLLDLKADLKQHGFATCSMFHGTTMPLDSCRNKLTQKALDWGADYLLYLDADQTFPEHMVGKMLTTLEDNPEWDIISAATYKKAPPYQPIASKYIDAEDAQLLSPVDPLASPRFQVVDIIGMGAILIKRRVLEAVNYPWFLYTAYDKTGDIGITEDVYFCNKVRELGFKIVVDKELVSKHVIMHLVGDEDWLNYRKILGEPQKNTGI